MTYQVVSLDKSLYFNDIGYTTIMMGYGANSAAHGNDNTPNPTLSLN